MSEPKLTLIFAAKDLASREAAKLHASLGGLNQQSTRLSEGMQRLVHRGIDPFHRAALGLLGGIKKLVMSPFGLVGLGAGLFGIEELLRRAVSHANEYATAVFRVGKISGLTTEQTSRLVAVMEKYGLDADAQVKTIAMLEKNVGLLTSTKKNATKFEKLWGFALTDNKGHVKDANALLLQAADYFNNKHIPASKRAALEAKLFGKSWQALVPILGLGKKGIIEAGDEAQKLGLVLTKDNVGALADYKKATRGLTEAWGAFQLKLGLVVMPVLTTLMTFATTTVIPGIQRVVGKVRDWFKANHPLIGQLGEVIGKVRDVASGVVARLLPAFAAIGRALFGQAGSKGGGRGRVGATPASSGIIGAFARLVDVMWEHGLKDVFTLVGAAFDVLVQKIGEATGPLTRLIDNTATEIELIDKVLKGLKELPNLNPFAWLAPAAGPWSGHGTLPGKAGGGPMLPGVTYKVGENRPELVTMNRFGGGRVHSSVPQRVGGGGAGLTVHVNTLWPPTPMQVKALLDEVNRYIARQPSFGASGNRV